MLRREIHRRNGGDYQMASLHLWTIKTIGHDYIIK